MNFSRYPQIKLLRSAALAFAILGSCMSLLAGSKEEKPKKIHGLSDVEHIVVIMMENRSFDHFLGWLPGATGRQAGLAYLDTAGASHPTHALAPDFQGCG